jgi:hypothetical protein
MSTANAARAAAPSTETDFQAFASLSLRPILQFVAAECLAALPASGLSVIDFIIQLLAANKQSLEAKYCSGDGCKQLDKLASGQNVLEAPSSAAAAASSNSCIHLCCGGV